MDVHVGTPPQTLSLLCDTASSDIIIATEACHTAACAGLDKFHPARSSTLQNSTQPFSIAYGSGAATGRMASDVVSVGGYTVVSQSFALVDQMQDGTVSAPTSGIFGIGLQELSAAGVTPFTEVLAKEHVLDQNVFSVQIARAGDSTAWPNTTVSMPSPSPAAETEQDALLGGIFTLGSIDRDQYAGDLNWIGVPAGATRLGYWSVPLEALRLNGATQAVNLVACLDLGTTYLAAPPDWVADFYGQIEGSAPQDDFAPGRFSIPCEAQVNVTLTFGGVEYPINATDFNAGTINNGTDCLGAFFASDSLSSTASDYPSFIIGATFLKNVFFAGNMSGPSVGLAPLVDSRAHAVATDVPGTPAATASTPILGGTTSTLSRTTGPVSTSISLPLPSSGAATTTSFISTHITTVASDQPSGPGLGSPTAPATVKATATSALSSADEAATRSLDVPLRTAPDDLSAAQMGVNGRVSTAGELLAAEGEAESDEIGKQRSALTSTGSDSDSTNRGSARGAASKVSVGSGSVLATAANGSLFASSTAPFTSVSVPPTGAAGSRIFWASGVSSPQGFANSDRAAASMIFHGTPNAAAALGPSAAVTATAAAGLTMLLAWLAPQLH